MITALQLNDVTKIYCRSHLGRTQRSLGIENVTLEVRPGEIYGLLGLNGSGKTTTIKLILGLLHPTAGEIRVLGHHIPSRKAQSQLGFLPETPYLSKFLTAEEVLAMFGRLSGIPESHLGERIEKVLEQVNMALHKKRRLREFSKGMLQRIALASALIHEPAILVFDEPATGLDPLALREIRELILALNTEGKTVLFSSHSISEVERICHRVGILSQGKLVQTLIQSDWKDREGKLEAIFIETVRHEVSS